MADEALAEAEIQTGEGAPEGALNAAVDRLFFEKTTAPAAPAAPVTPATPAAPEAGKKDGLSFDEGKDPSFSTPHFKKLKSERDAAVAELDTVRKRIAELEPLAKNTGEIETLRKEQKDLAAERDTLSDRLRVLAIERHPKFDSYFNQGSQKLVALSKAIVGADHADKAARLMSMESSQERTEQLDALFSELSPSQQSRLGAVLNRYEELQAERAVEISKSKEHYEKLTQSETENQQRQVEESNKVFEKEMAEAVSSLEVFQEGADAAWNGEIKKRLDMARTIYSGSLSPEDAAKASLWAAAAPLYRSLLSKQNEELGKLREQLKGFQSTNPNLQPSQGSNRNGETMGFIDAFMASGA